ncbi:MAG: VWA domain-containing protein [Bacteroidales bacterium]
MFRFAHPYYLYALILIPVFFLVFLLVMRRKKKKFKKFGDPEVVKNLLPDLSWGRQYLKTILLLSAFGLVVLALADPQIGSKLEKGERKGIDLFICLDVSNSMMAEDIKPNRLDRAKSAISKMIDELKNDRIGVVVFAGKSYVQLPITNDYSAAKLFLSSISPDIIPTQGTAIGEAIEQSVASFDQNKHSKAIIVISDGENHEDDAVESAKKAAEKGIKIFTVGMGLPEGAPIPEYRNGVLTGFKKDADGTTVVSRLNDKMLQQIAEAGQGSYVRASNTQSSLDKIFEEINKMQKSEFEAKIFSDYEDRFQYPLFLAFVLLVIELLLLERRNKLFSRIKLFN